MAASSRGLYQPPCIVIYVKEDVGRRQRVPRPLEAVGQSLPDDGRRIENVVPPPARLSTQTRPPSDSDRFLTIAKPEASRPSPGTRSSQASDEKTRGRSEAGTPRPTPEAVSRSTPSAAYGRQ